MAQGVVKEVGSNGLVMGLQNNSSCRISFVDSGALDMPVDKNPITNLSDKVLTSHHLFV